MWLIGMMGSGKTTVGRRAASKLAVPFFDTDEMIVETANRSISSIWDELGEDGFRQLEIRVIAEVPSAGCVAAAGGGAVILAENRQHIRAGAPVVWLRSAPRVLAERLHGDGERPLLDRGQPPLDVLTDLLEQRSALYAEVATEVIDTDGRGVDEVVTEVVEAWK